LSIAQFPIAYALAVRGVAKSRRGDPSPYLADARPSASATAPRSRHAPPRLTSPLEAQIWIERQIHRWTGKSFLIAVLPAVLLTLLFIAMLLGGHGREVQGLGSATIYLLFVSLIVESISAGSNFGSFQASVPWNQPRGAYLMPAYFGALPLSSGDFVWAKVRAAVVRVLWVSLGVVLLAALVAGISGYARAWMVGHAEWRLEYGLSATLALAMLPPLALVMLALSATCSVMWIVLLGRSKEVTIGILTVCWLCVLATRFKDAQIIAFLSALIPLAAGVKLGALAALVLYVGSRRMLSWPRLIAITGFWTATAGTLIAWLWWYAPPSLFTPMRSVCTGLLVAPVLGAVAAPLALARNRAR